MKDYSIVKICFIMFFFSLSIIGCTPNKDSYKQINQLVNDAGSLREKTLQGMDPSGNRSVSISSVFSELSLDELDTIASENHTVAICMHDLQNDWSLLQVQGIQAVLNLAGVDLIAVTDGELDVEKQIADYENVLALKPDVLITLPVDSILCRPVLKKIVDAGIKLIFMDAVPDNFIHGLDYFGMVMADSVTNAQFSADLLARYFNGKGKIAIIHWQHDMYTVNERSRVARETFAKFPETTIVAEVYFDGMYDVSDLTKTLLEKHPEIEGIWIVWDTPTMEAIKVIRDSGKPIVISTVDLGRELAEEIARGDIVIGTGAQHPYSQGVAEAVMALVVLAGKTPPPFVAIPAELVHTGNLEKGWENVFLSPLPLKIKELIDNR